MRTHYVANLSHCLEGQPFSLGEDGVSILYSPADEQLQVWWRARARDIAHSLVEHGFIGSLEPLSEMGLRLQVRPAQGLRFRLRIMAPLCSPRASISRSRTMRHSVPPLISYSARAADRFYQAGGTAVSDCRSSTANRAWQLPSRSRSWHLVARWAPGTAGDWVVFLRGTLRAVFVSLFARTDRVPSTQQSGAN